MYAWSWFLKAFETDLITQAHVHCFVKDMHYSNAPMYEYFLQNDSMYAWINNHKIRNLEWFIQMPFLFRANPRELALIISNNLNSKIEPIKDCHWDRFIQIEQKFGPPMFKLGWQQMPSCLVASLEYFTIVGGSVWPLMWKRYSVCPPV